MGDPCLHPRVRAIRSETRGWRCKCRVRRDDKNSMDDKSVMALKGQPS